MSEMICALNLAAAKAGNNIAARMAMMAITTNNSIKVKPCAAEFDFSFCLRTHVKFPPKPERAFRYWAVDLHSHSKSKRIDQPEVARACAHRIVRRVLGVGAGQIRPGTGGQIRFHLQMDARTAQPGDRHIAAGLWSNGQIAE